MNFRKKIGIFILASAIIITIILIFNTSGKPAKNNVLQPSPATAEAFKLSSKDNEKISSNTNLLALNSTDTLTDKITADISQQIFDLNNNNDLSSGQITVPNEDAISQDLIDKYQNDFWSNVPSVDIQDLNIIKDNIPQTSLDYLKNIFQIIHDNRITDDLIMSAIASFSDGQNADYLAGPINSLDKAIPQFKQMPVPASWAALHRDLININLAKRYILNSFVFYQDDPMRALINTEALNAITTKSNDWSNYVVEKLKQDNITFNF